MEAKTLADLISTLGFPIVVTVWLLYRDYRWISQIAITIQQQVDLLKQLTSSQINIKNNTDELKKEVEEFYSINKK